MEEPYGFVGVNAAGLPYATDGMNEAGLTVGVLFFPGFAEFQEPNSDQQTTTISSVDIANYLLGNFKTVEEVRQAMPKFTSFAIPRSRRHSAADTDPPYRHRPNGRIDRH